MISTANNIHKYLKYLIPYSNDLNIHNTVLKNGLETLIIQDKTIIKSGVLMIVKVGNLYEHISGLTHIIEHLLFSRKKVNNNDFDFMKYIAANGGYTNASTSTLCTNYYYSINKEKLGESLNMFMEFFKSQNFTNKDIEREINNIQFEYMKDTNLKSFKYNSILKCNCVKPYNMFNIGNYETLHIPNIRNEIINYFYKYYIPKNMKLVVFDNNEIECTLEKIKVFENLNENDNNISNNNFQIQELPFPFIAKNKVTQIYNNSRYSELLIFYAFNKNIFVNSIFKYIKYLICKKSNSSLFSILQTNNLINDISCELFINTDKYYIVNILINVSEYGINHIDVIITLIDHYINYLKNNNMHNNINNLHNYTQYNQSKKLSYLYDDRFINNNNVITKIELMCNNFNMLNVKLINALFGNTEYIDITSDNIKDINNIYLEILNNFNINNSCIIINSYKNHIKYDKKEKYFDIPYKIMDNTYLLNNTQFNFRDSIFYFNEKFLPPNEKIQVLLNKHIIQELNYTNKIFQPDKTKTIFISPSKSNIIKTNVLITFDIPKLYNNILLFVLSRILFNIITEKFESVLYEFKLSGGLYEIYINKNRVIIHIEGLNDIIVYTVHTLMNYIINNVINDISIELAKTDYKIFLENLINSPSYLYLYPSLDKILYLQSFTEVDQIKLINTVDNNDIRNLEVSFKNISNIKSLIYCNDKHISKQIYEIINHYDNHYVNNDTKNNNWTIVNIPEINNKVFKFYDNDKNNILLDLTVLLECSMGSTKYYKYRVFSHIIKKIIQPLFFNQYRVKQQLGYITKISTKIYGDKEIIISFNLFIQTNQEKISDSREILKDINTFMNNSVIKNMCNITENALNVYKNNYILKYSKDYVSQYKQSQYLFKNIIEENYNFDFNKIMINNINVITVDKLCKFYNKHYIGNTCVKCYIIVE